MPQDSAREPQTAPKSKFHFLRKRRTIIISLVMLGFLLLIPLIFLVSSIIRQNSVTSGEDTRQIFDVPYIGDELIVELKQSFTEEEIEELNKKFDELGVINQEKLSETNDVEFQNYYVLKFREGIDVRYAYEELEKLSQIITIAPNYIFEANFVPNDPYFNELWGLSKIDMTNAWEISQGANNVVVAVIDTGIDYKHPDLVGKNVIRGGDFSTCDMYQGNTSTVCVEQKSRDNDPLDENGHGTHIAGTIGAVVDNNIGISGVGYNVGLMAIKTMGRSSRGVYEDVFAGLESAVNDSRVRVINMSLGLSKPCRDLPGMQELINNAISSGKVVVVAAGNAAVDAISTSPASCNGTVAVGATDQNDKRAQFSNFGSSVDIAAPGVAILSTLLPGAALSTSCSDQNFGSPNDGYGKCNGTSMAAPHVAGVAALLLSQNTNLSSAQVASCLIDNADVISTDRNIGPRLNAFKTLNNCSGLPAITPSPSPTITPTAPPIGVPTLPPISSITPVISAGPRPSQINGVIFIDANNNSRHDTGEQGYGGAEIVLEPTNIRIISDSQGNFSFTNLSSGNYVVSSYINGQRTHFTNINDLQANTIVEILYGISQSLINPLPGQPTTSPNQTLPNILPTATSMPTPTPVKTYTCRENTGDYVSQGTLQLGSLICEPN